MKNVAVFGGSFINRIINKTNLGSFVTDRCMWLHPFTFGGGDDELDATKKLEDFLNGCTADTLIVELSSIRMLCFKTLDEKIYRYEDVKRYEKVKGIEVGGSRISASEIQDYEKSLYFFAKKIRKRFRKIVLISVRTQNIVKATNYYIPANDYWVKIQELFEKSEKIIVDVLKCSYLDITKYYIPYGKVDSFEFCDFFYSEIEDRINNILENKDIVIDNNINVTHKYMLTADGFNSLYRKGIFLKLLNMKNPIDVCISYSSKKFIDENLDNIIEWNKKGYKEMYSLIEGLSIYQNNKNALFEKMLLFIAKIINDIAITEEEEDLIEKNFVVNELLCTKVGKIIQSYDKNFQPKYVVAQNVRFYLNVLKGEKNNILFFSTQNMKMPTLIDVWGSCISRLIFNYAEEIDKERYVVNKYIFHANPLNINKGKEDFIQISNLRDEVYVERNLKLQLEGKLREYYEKTESKWIVVDLYSLFASNVYKIKKTYICVGEGNGNRFFPDKKCQPIFKEVEYNEILIGMIEFIMFLKYVYGDRIILVSAKNSIFYEKDNKLFEFEKQRDIQEVNSFLSKIEKWFVSATNCYYLDLAINFISKDELVFLGPFHYEKQLYIEEYKYIRQICEGTYEGKRYIDVINPNYFLKRFIKYKDKNSNIILKVPPYDKNKIWKYLINLDSNYINENFEEICKLILIASNYDDLENMRLTKLSQKEKEVCDKIFRGE